MPQLIAMVIVVVGAMIYMFQTFGGTGDKIEGIAQKTSIITEVNNIKNGLKLAARAEHISSATTPAGDAKKELKGLGELAYFPEQINDQVTKNTDTNAYYAISFGGASVATVGGMTIKLVASAPIGTEKIVPGIFVDLSVGSLKDNAGFLESQIATDLQDIAFIDRHAVAATAAATARGTATDLEKRTPANSTPVTTAGSESVSDGKFIIYFKDFGANEVVIDK
jgi:hypothetical protein